MDSNIIGGPTWNPAHPPLRATDGERLPLSVPEDPAPLASAHDDRIDLHLAPESLAAPTPAVAATILPAPSVEMEPPPPLSAPLPRAAVPVSLLAEEVPTGLAGGVQESLPMPGLGVLVQLDDVSLVHRMRAIDDRPRNDLPREFALVGPSTASRYLAHPEEMYLSL